MQTVRAEHVNFLHQTGPVKAGLSPGHASGVNTNESSADRFVHQNENNQNLRAVNPTFAGWFGKSEPKKPARRIYVLHSGMNDEVNNAAQKLREALIARGIPEDDIVIPETPYPAFFKDDHICKGKQPLKQWFQSRYGQPGFNIWRNYCTYVSSAQPTGEVAIKSYENLKKSLEAKRITPTDEVVWIGHSAGGQMGLTMAEMAHHDGKRYNFHSVITLGSPLLRNNAPKSTRIVNYISQADPVLQQSVVWGMDSPLIYASGYHIREYTPGLKNIDDIRDIENVGHSQWYKDDKVLDLIYADATLPRPAKSMVLLKKARFSWNRLKRLADKLMHPSKWLTWRIRFPSMSPRFKTSWSGTQK